MRDRPSAYISGGVLLSLAMMQPRKGSGVRHALSEPVARRWSPNRAGLADQSATTSRAVNRRKDVHAGRNCETAPVLVRSRVSAKASDFQEARYWRKA
eukprot:2067559-Pyramimonas_sp.AAC.1